VLAVATPLVASGCESSVRYSLASTGTPATPSGPVALAPNAKGYVRVQTKSESIRCSLTTDLVACQSSVADWPRHPDGTRFAAVSVTAAGDFERVDADLGQLAGLVTLDDRSYSAQGWSIAASGASIGFTNQRSGHGMSVDEDGVRSF
jgi:hypothetical protein